MENTARTDTTPFLKIKDAATATGLSQYYLRQGCKGNTVPHIRCGKTYKVNVPKLLEQLDAESATESSEGE